MAYKESEAKCDWCNSELGDSDDMACKECYEKLEQEIADLEVKVKDLEAELIEMNLKE